MEDNQNAIQHVFDNDQMALSTPQPPVMNTQSPPMIGAPSTPGLPSAYEMQHSMKTGNVKFAPDGVWHEYRTVGGVTFWKLDQ